MSHLALLLFAAGIVGLFYLDRDKSVHTSKAIWLPIIWLGIAGSRSPFSWFGMGAPEEIPGQLPVGSLPDQLLASSLLALGLVVLIFRRKQVSTLLKANWPTMLYFSFCLLSLAWSDFPAWGFKRWVRSLGDLIMVLLIATEVQPTSAFKRLLSRVGFVLLPASVLMIRYFPELGTIWEPFGDAQEIVGVSTNKNSLGDLVYLVGLGALWQILILIRDPKAPNRSRHLAAQSTLLAFAIYILSIAHCATAVACFVFGAALMVAVSQSLFRRSPGAVHALVFSIVLIGGLGSLLGARAAVTEALGRKPDLTGRTEIWSIVIPMAPNPIGGAGFETFWVGPRVAKLFTMIGGLGRTNEAHNGYIEVYLNLGLVGLTLIALILAQGYRSAVSVFRHDPAFGGLLAAYVVTAMTYSISEAGFRMLSLEWFFLLLAAVTANRVVSFAGETTEFPVPRASRWGARIPPNPARVRGLIVAVSPRNAGLRGNGAGNFQTAPLDSERVESQSRPRSNRFPLTTK